MTSNSGPSPDDGALAVVYRDYWTGPCDGDDTEAVAEALRASRWHFDVITAGPEGELPVAEALRLPGVRLYAQPGAAGDDAAAYRRQRADKRAIRSYVRHGGRYLGICMGAFLAEPGFFNIFRGRVDEYYSSKGASITTDDPGLVPVVWRGNRRALYFQDGGFMIPGKGLRKDATGLDLIALYSNGTIAALVAPFGAGKVGLCGPHPEAPPAWYREAGLRYPGPTQDMADDLIDSVVAG